MAVAKRVPSWAVLATCWTGIKLGGRRNSDSLYEGLRGGALRAPWVPAVFFRRISKKINPEGLFGIVFF